MKNRILAICDPETTYASRLMEYLNERQVSPFYARAFTSKEALRDFAGQAEIEVLLISSDMALVDLQGLPGGKRIWLTHGQIPAELEGEPVIYKYQSAEKIIREILYYYAEEAQPLLQAALLKEKIQMYGVCSPIGRTGKTTFALALGSLLAEKKRTLYLNLEPYSGFEQMLPPVSQWNLGDLLYFLKKGKQGFLYKLKSVTESLGRLDYIVPVRSPEDLLSVMEEEWEELLERLISEGEYECLVLDFSDCIQGLPALLEKCSRVYMPVREDGISRAKLKQFEDVLEMRGFERLRDSIRKVKLPRSWIPEVLRPEYIPQEMYQFVQEQEDW
ncbi:MAG: hypothetical protein IJ036_01720 [Lachnospiraceae bacterium]|nr:hypothetical protein [Lachnospiraceae bacterium]